jgi:hypothetical protein
MIQRTRIVGQETTQLVAPHGLRILIHRLTQDGREAALSFGIVGRIEPRMDTVVLD